MSYQYEKARLHFKIKSYEDAILVLNDIIDIDSLNPNYYLLKYKCLMKLGKFFDAENLITYIFSKFPEFKKGKIEYEFFMLNLNCIENFEVDDSSEVHDFISLAMKNKISRNSYSTKNNKNNKKFIIEKKSIY